VLKRTCLLSLLLIVLGSGCADELRYKDRMLPGLVRQVPKLLADYDASTGHFGKGIWICRDQHPMCPLAVAYSYQGEGNTYYKDPALLDVIMKAGDALIEDADENGQWVFRKKDGSTWGKISMPWTYSRWIQSFQMIRDDMPPNRREAWVKALTLGFDYISKTQFNHFSNIRAYHAMSLYIAGKTLDRPEWCEQASEFLMKVVDTQSEGGYYCEGGGPVIAYGFVYVDLLGIYYAVSGDERVLPALKKSAIFHRRFTYPSGQNVETIDQRNPFDSRVNPANVGFTFTPVGRAFLQSQWSNYGIDNLGADLMATLLLYGQEGSIAAMPSEEGDMFVMTEGGIDRAAVLRQGPWYVCLSAITTPISKSRWFQDRQNFVSIYHDKLGLILGGGNTKLQPVWSNFTVGRLSLLKHEPGDTNPDFMPKGELYHVPSLVTLVREPDAGIDLTYGKETCRVRVEVVDERTVKYRIQATAESGLPVLAHVTLIPHMGESLQTAAGQKFVLGDEEVTLSPNQIGKVIEHAGYRLRVPESASLHWPILPHNPYRKDGHAEPAEGRIEIRIPFDDQHSEYEMTLEILDQED